MKCMRKMIFIILFAGLILLCRSNVVFADEKVPHVYINGGEEDIYETGGSGSATFDKNSNTLTLNNYVGNSISFLSFEDGAKINIDVKGTNVIRQAEDFQYSNYNKYYYTICCGDYNNYKNYFGISADTDDENNINIEINGADNSKLKLENFYNGMFVYNGNVTLNNLNIETDGISYGNIYDMAGELNINNCKLEAGESSYGIIVECGDVHINNSEITLNGMSMDAFNQNGGILEFNNSKVSINKADRGIYADGVDIKNNTNMKICDSAMAISYYSELNIDKSDITIDNKVYTQSGDSYGIFGDGPTNITDSNLLINEVDFGCYYIYGNFVMNSGKTTINANKVGITGYDSGAKFNGGATFIDAGDGVAVYTENDMDRADNIYVDEKLKIVEDNIGVRKYNVGSEYYDAIGEDVNPSRITCTADVENLMANKVTIIPNTKLSFDGNNGNGTMEDVIGIYGEYTLPANTFEAPEGKQFKGWSLTATGEEIITTIDITGDTIVYAIWEDIPVVSYKVTFNSNGGNDVKEQLVQEGSKIVKPSDPVKEGYAFAGWYIDDKCTEEYNFDEPVSADIILYAKWNVVEEDEEDEDVTDDEPTEKEETKKEEPTVIEQKEDSKDNPKTGDTIRYVVGIMTVAIAGAIITIKKSKNNK